MFLALLCPFWAVHGQSSPSPLLDAYNQALEEAQSGYEAQIEKLGAFYVNYLEDLARKAQQEGDLEALIVLKAEQQAIQEQGQPPEGMASPAVKKSREAFLAHAKKLEQDHAAKKADLDRMLLENLEQEITRLTRAGQIEDAQSLRSLQKDLLGEQTPPTPTPEEKPTVTLGPNVLPNGSFDDAPERAWRISSPGGRNKTGLYQEPNSGMNMVLRLEQEDRHRAGAQHHIRLKTGQTYRLRWRTRLLRPWRTGIELRGKGHYKIGLRIPGNIWNAWTEVEQRKHRHRVDVGRQPPPDREWRWEEAELKVHNKYMTELFIYASNGEGDFLIDDLEIRELIPPEKKKK